MSYLMWIILKTSIYLPKSGGDELGRGSTFSPHYFYLKTRYTYGNQEKKNCGGLKTKNKKCEIITQQIHCRKTTKGVLGARREKTLCILTRTLRINWKGRMVFTFQLSAFIFAGFPWPSETKTLLRKHRSILVRGRYVPLTADK